MKWLITSQILKWVVIRNIVKWVVIKTITKRRAVRPQARIHVQTLTFVKVTVCAWPGMKGFDVHSFISNVFV